MNKDNKLLTIGQFAAMHGPPKPHSGNDPPTPGTGSSNQRSAKFYEEPFCPKFKKSTGRKNRRP